MNLTEKEIQEKLAKGEIPEGYEPIMQIQITGDTTNAKPEERWMAFALPIECWILIRFALYRLKGHEKILEKVGRDRYLQAYGEVSRVTKELSGIPPKKKGK